MKVVIEVSTQPVLLSIGSTSRSIPPISVPTPSINQFEPIEISNSTQQLTPTIPNLVSMPATSALPNQSIKPIQVPLPTTSLVLVPKCTPIPLPNSQPSKISQHKISLKKKPVTNEKVVKKKGAALKKEVKKDSLVQPLERVILPGYESAKDSTCALLMPVNFVKKAKHLVATAAATFGKGAASTDNEHLTTTNKVQNESNATEIELDMSQPNVDVQPRARPTKFSPKRRHSVNAQPKPPNTTPVSITPPATTIPVSNTYLTPIAHVSSTPPPTIPVSSTPPPTNVSIDLMIGALA
ncbi:uncharacterized protein LOC107620367 [Arachis ipaensis]|uniref:uncharacterized protein LOC107620367 n=1 Tax=Arachis ipaensis TaxID=130454 RepID=UPI0007AF8840|nr:uncharacterized protein LOC107620367 [Arachis ipaensis]XP_025684887.1 uncharacterized protein LOC112785656 [Arachis hypogaea]